METNFSIGDTVSVINDILWGKIISIENKTATIEDQQGFEFSCSVEELVPHTPDLYKDISIRTEKKAKKIDTPPSDAIDLHIHCLSSERNLEPWQRLFIQKQALIEGIARAKKSGRRKVKIIHGIGDGVVQQMVHDVLHFELRLEFHNEEILHHQSGSVVVYL